MHLLNYLDCILILIFGGSQSCDVKYNLKLNIQVIWLSVAVGSCSYFVANRFKIRYPSLLDQAYTPEKFEFRHTYIANERTKDSAKAFAQELFGNIGMYYYCCWLLLEANSHFFLNIWPDKFIPVPSLPFKDNSTLHHRPDSPWICPVPSLPFKDNSTLGHRPDSPWIW